MTLAHTLAEYAVPAALITMLPGPDTAMILTTAVKAGRGAAVRAAWGVGTGLLLWGAAAAVGLATALRDSAILYDTFRYVCAVYLVVLAVQAWQTSRSEVVDPAALVEPRPCRRVSSSLGWGYRRALLTCVLNPKLGVFFVVFLPQFIPAGAPVAAISFTLAALQAAEAVLWYLLLGRAAATAGRALARQQVRAWLDRVTAIVFLGFGLRVATDDAP